MTVFVTKTIKVQEVRKGDNLSGVGTVGIIEGKTKFYYIYPTDSEKPARIAIDTPVTVVREEKTDEEKAAERSEMVNEMIVNWISRTKAAFAKASEELQKHITSGYMGVSPLESYYGAQADLHLAAMLEKVSENYPSLQEAAHVLRESFKEDLINNSDAPTYSGGFSFSNAARQSTQDAARRFVRNYFLM